MQTRLTLNFKNNFSFFTAEEKQHDLAVCKKFVSKILNISPEIELTRIKVSFASKNPKERNWKKIERTHSNYVAFKDNSFPVCIEEQRFLNAMGVENFFWIKIEVL